MSELILSRDIYSLKKILYAKEMYKDIANIAVMEQEKAFMVQVKDCVYDEIKTAKEFENYLIGLENS